MSTKNKIESLNSDLSLEVTEMVSLISSDSEIIKKLNGY